MALPGRTVSSSTYRYGFNGKEKDKDMNSLTAYDYGFRIYNPAIGKFLSVDPLTKFYSMLTPYQFSSNRPIDGIDLDGLEYLRAADSKIDISVATFTFNGKTVLHGSVKLNREAISSATRNFLDNAPQNDVEGYIGSSFWNVATFEHPDYKEMYDAQLELLKPTLKKADEEDIKSESIEQSEITVQKKETKKSRIVKPKEQRDSRVPNRAAKVGKTSPASNSEPKAVGSGVATGSAKGDVIMLAVEATTTYLINAGTKRIQNDYNAANGQLSAVNNALNDVQFALNNKIILPNSVNITDFANYLLDGRKPEINGYTTDSQGRTINLQATDFNAINTFNKIIDKISEAKRKQSDNAGCVPCNSTSPPGTSNN